MDLFQKQKELQKEARELLKEIGLIEYLSEFGEIEIGGSLDSDLMVWRDIDLGVISENLNEKNYWKMVQFLFNLNNYYHSLYIQDFRKSINPNSPKGLYIGMKIKFKDNIWKIDVWYVKPRREADLNYNNWLKDKLNDDNRKIILEIKNQVYANPKYRKEIFAIDIYNAVINKDVTDLNGFKDYIKKEKNIVI